MEARDFGVGLVWIAGCGDISWLDWWFAYALPDWVVMMKPWWCFGEVMRVCGEDGEMSG